MTQLVTHLPALQIAPRASSKIESYGLRDQVLSPLETFGQSVANIAPTGTPTVVVPLVFGVAGVASWFAYAFALVGILFVSFSINVFARRSASPGSIYTYVASGIGPAWGAVVGWALFVAYVACASSVTSGFANYVNVLIKSAFHLTADLPPWVLVGAIAASVAGSWYIAYKDVRLSTRLMLALELLSVSFILLVLGAALLHNGLRIDRRQLALSDLTVSRLRLGLIFAIFSFTGFESATSLGSEARDPLRTIPRAVLQSAVFVGLLFVLASYTEVLGFGGYAVSLDKSDAPLQVLADLAGVPFLGVLITVGAIISFFACVLASITAGSRVLFLMGRHGLLHSSVGGAHSINETPHVALAISAILALVPAVALAAAGQGMFAIYGLIGTTATLGFIVAYIGVSIAAPVYLHRRGELRLHHVIVSLVGIGFMSVALVGAVYPLPDAPASYPIYGFFALLVAGAVWIARRYLKSADLSKSVKEDLAAIEERYESGAGI
jgi:amino acid transporter